MKHKKPTNSMGPVKRTLAVASVVMLVPIFVTMVLPMLLLTVPLAIGAAPFIVFVFASGAEEEVQRDRRLSERPAAVAGHAYADAYA
jgi:hypothetical protein